MTLIDIPPQLPMWPLAITILVIVLASAFILWRTGRSRPVPADAQRISAILSRIYDIKDSSRRINTYDAFTRDLDNSLRHPDMNGLWAHWESKLGIKPVKL